MPGATSIRAASDASTVPSARRTVPPIPDRYRNSWSRRHNEIRSPEVQDSNGPETAYDKLAAVKILVTGATGQLGATLIELARSHEVLGLKRPEVDLRDTAAVRRAVQSFRPDAVLHPAALTHVDYCEDHPEEAHAVNAVGTENVVRAAGGARVVYLSTEYVFDGRNGPYSEEDSPNPLSAYGRSKLDGETAARTAERWTIVRTTGVYTYRAGSTNFLMQVLEGKPVRGLIDQFYTPTLTENLAQAVLELAERGLGGIYNIVGADRVNRFDFVRRIHRRFGMSENLLTPATTAELRQRAPRPLNAGLRIEKAVRDLKTRLLGLDESLDFAYRKAHAGI